MQAQSAALTQVIRAIGSRDFAAVSARAILDLADFQLATVVLHGRPKAPRLLFDNFDLVQGRRGIENYISHTHAINPMLSMARRQVSVFRARDFVGSRVPLQPFLVRSTDEELGFRTVGWPAKLEEVGLYVSTRAGLLELSLYRERGRAQADDDVLEHIHALGAPLAAAFDQHMRCARFVQDDRLSPREREVTRLMLEGLGSEAIARRLSISRHTVKDHRKRIFRKLNIRSLAELFARTPSREG